METKFKYMSIKDVVECERYPFSHGQIRCWLLNRNENGLDKSIRKIGKNVYFRSDLFDKWIESHNN